MQKEAYWLIPPKLPEFLLENKFKPKYEAYPYP